MLNTGSWEIQVKRRSAWSAVIYTQRHMIEQKEDEDVKHADEAHSNTTILNFTSL